jgi:diacylglycerol kinase family enzyme
VEHLPRRLAGRPRVRLDALVDLDDVVCLRGRDVAVRSAAPVTAYGDGERLAPLPVSITVRDRALTVLV